LTFIPISNVSPPFTKPTTKQVTVLFSNSRQKPIHLVRLDADGERHEERVLAGASRGLIHTFSGQTFLIVDDSGKNLGHVVVGEKPASLRIE
jgi:hypothetical protein